MNSPWEIKDNAQFARIFPQLMKLLAEPWVLEELPTPPGPERVLINAGPQQRTPIRTSGDRTPIATGGSKPRIPIRSGGGPGT